MVDMFVIEPSDKLTDHSRVAYLSIQIESCGLEKHCLCCEIYLQTGPFAHPSMFPQCISISIGRNFDRDWHLGMMHLS